MSPTTKLPLSLTANPRLDRWIKFEADRTVRIASGKVDAINDYTIHSLHHLIAESSFSHDLHLMTQKPLAVTIAAGQRMCDQAEAANRVFAVFENARFAPGNRHLKWAIEEGLLGRPQLVLMGNVGTWWTPNRIVANTPWRHDKMEAGGISLDLGVHHFNAVRFLAGEIDTVQGQVSIQEKRRVQITPSGETVAEILADADDTYFGGTRFIQWN